jgi:putative tryptophan/tyrosine transport system substrate-binding protein
MLRRDMILGIGGAIAAPAVANAQQKTMPVIGWLSSVSPTIQGGSRMPESGTYESLPVATWTSLAAFAKGLSETGYVEGQNVAIEYRWAEGHFDRLPALAADLVAQKVDVIVAAGGTASALAAKGAASTIPIVFSSAADPVETGLVASLARPGGNLTGFTAEAAPLEPKRLELLSELVPQARLIVLLVDPSSPIAERIIRDALEAAHVKGVQLQILKAGTESEIDAAFASLVELHAGALLVGSNPFFFQRREQLVALAAHYAVPAIYPSHRSVTAGGLISYSERIQDLYRGAGAYVGRILAGAKPADLPVQQPTKFELVINLKTAKALGLTVPPLLLATADEVIE